MVVMTSLFCGTEPLFNNCLLHLNSDYDYLLIPPSNSHSIGPTTPIQCKSEDILDYARYLIDFSNGTTKIGRSGSVKSKCRESIGINSKPCKALSEPPPVSRISFSLPDCRSRHHSFYSGGTARDVRINPRKGSWKKPDEVAKCHRCLKQRCERRDHENVGRISRILVRAF